MAVSSSTATKSIDVGSMFLMDLSIQESDSFNESSIGEQPHNQLNNETNDNFVFPYYQKSSLNKPSSYIASNNHQYQLETTASQQRQPKRQLYVNENFVSDQQVLGNDDYLTNQVDEEDYLANSLDRLASAIRNKDDQSEYQYNIRNSNKRFNRNSSNNDVIVNDDSANDNRQMTVAEPQPLPELKDPLSSSSLSDESFVASSGTSLSASFIASSDGDNEDRGSTATREDSGVLDMRDLDNQLNTYDRRYDDEDDDDYNHHQHHNHQSQKQQILQEKPISMTTTTNKNNNINKATNLIINKSNNSGSNKITAKTDKSAENHNQYDSYYIAGNSKQPTNSRPTNGNASSSSNGNGATDSNNHQQHHHHNHNHHHHHSVTKSKRPSMSASLPIQVPARQMKKDLNKLKLIMNRNLAAGELEMSESNANNGGVDANELPTARRGFGKVISNNSNCNNGTNLPASGFVLDEFDEFLDQEYNENHHNHYPIDEFDEEHVRAGENPMKLFASIQALARSLHKDAELFGSLPPKRLLESPIRSLALA